MAPPLVRAVLSPLARCTVEAATTRASPRSCFRFPSVTAYWALTAAPGPVTSIRAFTSSCRASQNGHLKDPSSPPGADRPPQSNDEARTSIQDPHAEQDPHAHASDAEKPSIEATSVAEEPEQSRPTSDAFAKTRTNAQTSAQSDLLARLRGVGASLPSFDALTSTASLSSAVSVATERTRTLASSLRTRLSALAAQYNDYSGYAAIEQLKLQITQLESELEAKRALASQAKRSYLASVQSRSASQRETNDLLSRKNSWTEADLSRYTELLRTEHTMSRHEAETEKQLDQTEAEVQAAFDELMKAVMVRYHEEQLWSDRMRGMSTYGSLIVAGLNAFLFILAILLVEPYKRKKLAQTFESRLVAAEEQSRQLILASVEHFQHSLDAALAAQTPETSPAPAPETVEQQPAIIAPPPVAGGAADAAVDPDRIRKLDEERLVFASTIGVVVGAALSLLIGACWS